VRVTFAPVAAFIAELRRRKVIPITLAYLVVAWLLAQVSATIEPALDLPSWFDTFVIVLLAIGFPIWVLFVWVFDITPHGLEVTPRVPDKAASPAPDATAPAPALPPAEPRPKRDPRSVAVLPFVNLSSDPEQEYFSDGLSEELLNVLARIDALRVAGRTSSFAFKGRKENLRVIGEQLRVANILEGAVRKAGAQLRITAQLVNTDDGYHLWSQTYDRELNDVFAVQDEIARAVAAALRVTLGVAETSRIEGGTDDVRAYDLYLRARALLHQGGPAELQRAAENYRKAIALDPSFTLAWLGLRTVMTNMLIYVPEKSDEARRLMAEADAHVLAAAPDAWWAQALRGSQARLAHEWEQAEVAARAAAEAAPSSDVSAGASYASLLAAVGRVGEAIEVARRARDADPLSLYMSGLLQHYLGVAGRFEEAQAEYERSQDLPGDRAIWEWYAVIRHWAQKSADPSAIAAQFRVFLEHESVPMALNRELLPLLDDREAARAAVRRASEDPANADATRMSIIAWYADHFGDRDLALAALRRSLVDHGGTVFAMLWWPFETGLRADPRFKEIVRDLKLVDYWRATGSWGDYCRPKGDGDFECT
jgi:TolB-like protein